MLPSHRNLDLKKFLKTNQLPTKYNMLPYYRCRRQCFFLKIIPANSAIDNNINTLLYRVKNNINILFMYVKKYLYILRSDYRYVTIVRSFICIV